MVVRNVPKLHAFIVLGLATATAPLGCSDGFEGCAASRTCPADEAGAGGEAGAGMETGGVSGSTSGTSGEAGADDGGRGGTGGSGGSGGSSVSGGEGGTDAEPPTVEAFTPSDGSADVERDIEVTAELSEPIDEATVTETSVTLTGPDGEVTGTLSVDENVIRSFPTGRSTYSGRTRSPSTTRSPISKEIRWNRPRARSFRYATGDGPRLRLRSA